VAPLLGGGGGWGWGWGCWGGTGGRTVHKYRGTQAPWKLTVELWKLRKHEPLSEERFSARRPSGGPPGGGPGATGAWYGRNSMARHHDTKLIDSSNAREGEEMSHESRGC